ncbi:hypothetical protein HYT02_03415 [Candidatus Gottesmanbacteria bacterium]|nr:hypothetical protein [Candidatus Gottesmanbacteria bacterium]
MNERGREFSHFKQVLAITLALGVLELGSVIPVTSSQSPDGPIPVPTGSTEGPNLTVTDASACYNDQNQVVFNAKIGNNGLKQVDNVTTAAGVVNVSGEAFDAHVASVETPSLKPFEGAQLSWKSEPIDPEILNSEQGWYVEADWNHEVYEMGQGDSDNTFFGSTLKKCTSVIKKLWFPLVTK